MIWESNKTRTSKTFDEDSLMRPGTGWVLEDNNPEFESRAFDLGLVRK